MKIKVCEENKEKINKIIKEIEGKATARTCDYRDVLNLTEKVEKHLNKYNCPKKYRNGVNAYYSEKIGVNAYKKFSYKASTTEIKVYRGSKDWFLVAVFRIEIDPGDKSSEYTLIYPTHTIENVLRVYEKEFKNI